MTVKCFWLLSDEKTVREITHGELRKLHYHKKEHKLLMVHSNGSILVLKGTNAIWISNRQLKQTWKGAKP